MAGHPRSAPSSDNDRVVVPHLNKDPIWSLKPWPATVTVAGLDIEIPALCAADWLAILMQAEPDLDALIADYMPEAEELLFEGTVSLEELYEVSLELIALVSARPWWVTLRLISVARGSWDVLGGEMSFRHIDATQISLSAWLDVLLLVTLRSMEPKDTTMFTMRLEAPPETEEAEEPEMSAGAFMAMAG